MSQAGPTPGETQESSGPIDKVWKDIEVGEEEEGASFCRAQQTERGAHLSSGSRVTLLHTRPREAHLNAVTAASNTGLQPQEKTLMDPAGCLI